MRIGKLVVRNVQFLKELGSTFVSRAYSRKDVRTEEGGDPNERKTYIIKKINKERRNKTG